MGVDVLYVNLIGLKLELSEMYSYETHLWFPHVGCQSHAANRVSDCRITDFAFQEHLELRGTSKSPRQLYSGNFRAAERPLL